MKFSKAGQKGSTLVLTLLIIGSLTTFGIVSIYSAADKHKQVGKERLEREAFHLADGGISDGASDLKALELTDPDGFIDTVLLSVTDYIEETVFLSPSSYSMLHKFIAATPPDTSDTTKKYQVWIADNDDTAYTSAFPSNDDIPSPTDNVDVDRGVVLVSKGWIEDGSGTERVSIFLKGLFKRVPYDPEFALLTGGDISMNGSISVTGSTPSIHTNSNFTSIGGADEAEGPVTASGTMTGSVNLTGGGSTGTGNASLIDIPGISAAYYKSIATSFVWDTSTDPILDGTCERAPAAGTDCVKICNSGGTYTVTSPKPPAASVCRRVGGAVNASGVFYFDGPVNVETSGEWAAVVIATGEIELKTGTEITGSSDLEGVALVTDDDIEFRGGVTIGGPGPPVNQLGMYVGGKFDLGGGGNKTLYGPMIAVDGVATTSLSGNISIYYDNTSPPLNGPLIGKLISWSVLE